MSVVDLSELLNALIRREDLTADQVGKATQAIAAGNVDSHQIAAFLVLLSAKGESAAEIMGMAKVMREHSLKPVLPGHIEGLDTCLDIVGTGGDGFNTVNISTASAILTSSCGVLVAKHGSTSVSSSSGSSDVMQTLGISLLDHTKVGKCLETAGICFMFAPKFHPAMKHVVPVRKALKVRSIFNILGPLLNPMGVKRMLLGVYSFELLPIYAEAIFKLGIEHAMVVHGSGMDELNCLGPVQAIEVTKKSMTPLTIDPEALGLPKCTLADLKGGSPTENAEIIRKVFSADPKYARLADTICLNSAVALYVSDTVDSIAAGLVVAKRSLESGAALAKLQLFGQTSQSLEIN